MGRVTPYRYGQEGLTRVGQELRSCTGRPRYWPAVALVAVFLGIFCRTDSPYGFATAAPNPAARSYEMNLRMAGVVSAVLMAGTANAQNAVQWRVEDGGNGHWYSVRPDPKVTWTNALLAATKSGGYLATVTSPTENQFVRSLALATPGAFVSTDFGPFLGGLQVADGAGAIEEPSGSWRWCSGETWSFTNWLSTEPNDFDCGPDTAPENYLQLYRNGSWNDSASSPVECGGRLCVSYAVEWSADCNSDGIVDYGQIRAGELADTNANNIPDCCETGTVCGCPADVILDGVVNGIDLAVIINAWSTDGGKFPRADIDGNGFVDGADLAIVLGSWGPCS